MSFIYTFTSIVLLLVLQVGSSFAQAQSADYIMCRNKKVVRTIRIEKVGAECKTIYTKAGQDKDVGGGKFEGHCDKIADNIKVNLEKAGWTCKNVAAAGITEAK